MLVIEILVIKYKSCEINIFYDQVSFVCYQINHSKHLKILHILVFWNKFTVDMFLRGSRVKI